MDKNSKIYIAGHRGLVGSAIWNNLKEKGYTNLIGRTSYELDLKDTVEVEKFFKLEQPEYVFLCAAKVGGIQANNTMRADFIYENLQIQNNIIHLSHKYNVKKLLFLGSTCIYPKNCTQPIKEEYLLTSELEYTNEPYAIAKIAGIKMCENYNLQYNTNFISVMPTNLYGPNDNYDLETSHVLPALVRKIYLAKCLYDNELVTLSKDLDIKMYDELKLTLNKYGIHNDKVEIWGDGTPMREFLYSTDMADACVYIMNNCNVNDIDNSPINIGTGIDISIKKLALLIKDEIGYKGDLYFNDSKPNGTLRKVTDVTKLHNLGWKHTINIKDGIKKILNDYEFTRRLRKTH